MTSSSLSALPARRVLVTGGNGFVGHALGQALHQAGQSVTLCTRVASLSAIPATARLVEAGVRWVGGCELSKITPWSHALQGMDVVVHCAARVHQLNDRTSNPLEVYRAENTAASATLAVAAAAAGVRRFVFLSSVKVNGEFTAPGNAFRAADQPQPSDPYGISKLEAELTIQQIASTSGMEFTIIRPPLVYGPGVKANFHRLMGAIQQSRWLPLGAVTHNRRSMIGLDNLVDLIKTCAYHPMAANQTMMASDGEDLSTADLVLRLAKAMNQKPRLLPVPPWLLQATASAIGKRDVALRLLGNLQVDSSPTRSLLGWQPPLSVDEGLMRAVRGLLHPPSCKPGT